MNAMLHSYSVRAIALTALLLTTLPALADPAVRSNDPFGWSRQTNANGIARACESYRIEYDVIVDLHNAADPSSNDRREYRERLREIQQQMNSYGC